MVVYWPPPPPLPSVVTFVVIDYGTTTDVTTETTTHTITIPAEVSHYAEYEPVTEDEGFEWLDLFWTFLVPIRVQLKPSQAPRGPPQRRPRFPTGDWILGRRNPN